MGHPRMMFLQLLLLPASAFGHGNMVWPPVWWDVRGEIGLKGAHSCQAGWQYTFQGDPHKRGTNCHWFTNDTEIVGEPTLEPALWTFPNVESWAEQRLERHPWRAPGYAPLYSPCGVAGGNPLGCPKGAASGPGSDCHNGGFSYGPKAEEMDFEDPVTTEWIAGTNQVVGWGIIANHGGGYSYRLCKLPQEGRIGLSEECFQQTPLKFASDISWASGVMIQVAGYPSLPIGQPKAPRHKVPNGRRIRSQHVLVSGEEFKMMMTPVLKVSSLRLQCLESLDQDSTSRLGPGTLTGS